MNTSTNTYVKEGDPIHYQYLVKNEGEVVAYSVNLTEFVPEGVGIRNVSYTVNGVETSRGGVIESNVNILTNLDPGAEMVVDLDAVALSLNGAEEKLEHIKEVLNKHSIECDFEPCSDK